MPIPIKIKVFEKTSLIPKSEREKLLKKAGYNLFLLKSNDVYIDFLTDSGTSSQSSAQIAASFLNDTSYAGSRSFYRMKKSVKDIFGYEHVVPAHQGRGAENIFNRAALKHGQLVLGNMHFDTTRAHIEDKGGIAVDCQIKELFDTKSKHPFKGNLDIKTAEKYIKKNPDDVAYILITVTCNSGGGQPVSYANIKATSHLAKKYNIPLFLDAARIFENAYFIKKREKGMAKKSVRQIVREICALCNGLLMSAKKNGLVSMGGLIAMKRNNMLFRSVKNLCILNEGFPTYGGMSSRDMEMLAVGLHEWSDEEMLGHHIENAVGHLGEKLRVAGIPILEPIGGHAVYIDVKRFLPHIPQEKLPGQALACALYIEGGIRTCEIGTVLSGRDKQTGKNRYPKLELLRLAIPRMVYLKDHFDYVADITEKVFKKRNTLRGMAFKKESPELRHFDSEFRTL